MYNVSEEFYKIFNNKEFNDFIDKTYLELKDIRGKRDYGKIECDADFVVNKYHVKYEFGAGIFGMPGSGKTTLSSKIGKEILSTDKFLDEIREENPVFPAPDGKSDIFRKHEYKVITCLILSGLANNKILDFGGGALLQPGLAVVSKKVFGDKLINLSIEDEDRIYNLTQDTIILGDKSSRDVVNKAVKANKAITKENLEKLKKECDQLISEYGSLAKAKDKIKELKEYETFKKLYEICEKFDHDNRWRKDIFNEASEALSFEKALEKLELSGNKKNKTKMF